MGAYSERCGKSVVVECGYLLHLLLCDCALEVDDVDADMENEIVLIGE